MTGSTFSLEGAIVAKAHSKLRMEITEAAQPLRAVIERVLLGERRQALGADLSPLEAALFQDLHAKAEQDGLQHFVATYEEVAQIVNDHKRASRVHLEKANV